MKKFLNKISAVCAVFFACLMMTGCSTTGAEGTQGGGASSIILLVVMLAVLYFIMIRPESKKRKKAEEMRNSLSVGDKITTIGGMVGKIVDISNDLITFETGEDRVRIQVTKWAISSNSVEKNADSSGK